ncbi:hypothetical protein PMAYCL1PPCAC_27783, partial [Pristionchus mayeri]
ILVFIIIAMIELVGRIAETIWWFLLAVAASTDEGRKEIGKKMHEHLVGKMAVWDITVHVEEYVDEAVTGFWVI